MNTLEKEQREGSIRYHKGIDKLIKTAKKTVMKIPAKQMKVNGKLGMNLIVGHDGEYRYSYETVANGYIIDCHTIINSKRMIMEQLEQDEFENELKLIGVKNN